MRGIWPLLGLLLASGCGGGGASAPDAGPQYAAWDPTLPSASVMGVRRGLTPARGIIHLHSPYSHDACDGEPKNPDGTIKEDCLADLRFGLCKTHQDYASLTDHDASMADVDWGPEIFVERGSDEPIMDTDGNMWASRIHCDDGHTVLLFVGGENDLMPIMLHGHPPGDLQTRHDVYNGNTPDTVLAYKALGGIAWIAHSESKDIALLRTLGLDGMEIYNLHANIDPNIRPMYLGLDASGAITAAVQFASMEPPAPEPDLALVSFLLENQPSLDKWHTLLSEGVHIPGSAGSDAHENALPIILKDGERGDSYRRVLRWFANVVLVADPTDPVQIHDALEAGRMFVVFEVFGTPEGFDWRADQNGGSKEMGDTVTLAGGAITLTAVTPTIHAFDARLPAPEITTRILHVAGGAATEVASGTGTVTFTPTEPGAYYSEVKIVPHHIEPYLGTLAAKGYAGQSYVWIYGNPIYVE
jgi:hypothetical protein